jgi:hypothetical protein
MESGKNPRRIDETDIGVLYRGRKEKARVNPARGSDPRSLCVAPRRQFLFLRAWDGVEAHQVQRNVLREIHIGVHDHGGTEDFD